MKKNVYVYTYKSITFLYREIKHNISQLYVNTILKIYNVKLNNTIWNIMLLKS